VLNDTATLEQSGITADGKIGGAGLLLLDFSTSLNYWR
jgi:hypothetical protein